MSVGSVGRTSGGRVLVAAAGAVVPSRDSVGGLAGTSVTVVEVTLSSPPNEQEVRSNATATIPVRLVAATTLSVPGHPGSVKASEERPTEPTLAGTLNARS